MAEDYANGAPAAPPQGRYVLVRDWKLSHGPLKWLKPKWVPKPMRKRIMAKDKKHWIAGAIKHKGALHKMLGVPQKKKIGASKLAKAAKAGGLLGRRARLAETLEKMHKR